MSERRDSPAAELAVVRKIIVLFVTSCFTISQTTFIQTNVYKNCVGEREMTTRVGRNVLSQRGDVVLSNQSSEAAGNVSEEGVGEYQNFMLSVW